MINFYNTGMFSGLTNSNYNNSLIANNQFCSNNSNIFQNLINLNFYNNSSTSNNQCCSNDYMSVFSALLTALLSQKTSIQNSIPSNNAGSSTSIDETSVSVSEKPAVHGYTKEHVSMVHGEANAEKMWNLYDANKDGILDHEEEAALRATFAKGTAGTWTPDSVLQMFGQEKTPESFYENLKNIKSLENKEDSVYYRTALYEYNRYYAGKVGTV